ncbi:cytochrome o ubiquinol oxidase subunit 2 [Lysobacter sp. OAE881]|uniref:ubiquinol oxidase subunit II n=1 Tax=Lysobacter TaxID=68 RepID=UPI0012EDE173|nr:ubiquinol oxidase subunit II [Lysobacter soli]MDG2518036.1 ubiquinol oxidase subunit II [Lysobacter soli]QGW64951.1 ubiquinol oxidase subunit II [Lysobacter soli]
MSIARRFLQAAVLLLATVALSGCNLLVLNPAGDIAARQGQLIVVATVLMLIVIVPVIALTLLFAWRYRASNNATYKPDWDHSTQLELVIWGIPLLIIIALGAITWISTHLLDPFRPLDQLSAGRPVPADVKPLEIQVVALDWKWLFVYPEENIATVNEVVVPVDRPVHFRITASSVMNTFYVPALAGMIYGMPGMESELNAVINEAGVYDGFSANYSGAGFSHMRFKFHGRSDAEYQRWVNDVRGSSDALTRATYLELEKPSEREPVRHFARVDNGLFDAVLNRCVDTDRLCMNQMMAIDATGGLGLDGLKPLATPRRGDPRLGAYVSSEVCSVNDAVPQSLSGSIVGMKSP